MGGVRHACLYPRVCLLVQCGRPLCACATACWVQPVLAAGPVVQGALCTVWIVWIEVCCCFTHMHVSPWTPCRRGGGCAGCWRQAWRPLPLRRTLSQWHLPVRSQLTDTHRCTHHSRHRRAYNSCWHGGNGWLDGWCWSYSPAQPASVCRSLPGGRVGRMVRCWQRYGQEGAQQYRSEQLGG